jgi:hypothetical protein
MVPAASGLTLPLAAALQKDIPTGAEILLDYSSSEEPVVQRFLTFGFLMAPDGALPLVPSPRHNYHDQNSGLAEIYLHFEMIPILMPETRSRYLRQAVSPWPTTSDTRSGARPDHVMMHACARGVCQRRCASAASAASGSGDIGHHRRHGERTPCTRSLVFLSGRCIDSAKVQDLHRVSRPRCTPRLFQSLCLSSIRLSPRIDMHFRSPRLDDL